MVVAGHPRYVPPGGPDPEGESTALKEGRIYISAGGDGQAQYFEGVAPEVWEFRVGGYQVCQKWLKDRRKRKLDLGEIKMYQRMIATIGSTIAIMAELDEIAPTWPLETAGRQAAAPVAPTDRLSR